MLGIVTPKSYGESLVITPINPRPCKTAGHAEQGQWYRVITFIIGSQTIPYHTRSKKRRVVRNTGTEVVLVPKLCLNSEWNSKIIASSPFR